MNNIHDKIMLIVNEWESSDKTNLIEELLIMLGEDTQCEILIKLEEGIPLLEGD